MPRTTAPKNKKRNQARARASSRPSVVLNEESALAAPVAPAANQASPARRQVTPYQTRFKLPNVVNRTPSSISTAIPRETEYAFIRADLYRLLIIAGILTVVMILLLLIVD